MSIVLIPINGNSFKLVPWLVSGMSLLRSLQKHQETPGTIWIVRHSKGTNAFRFNIRWRTTERVRMHNDATGNVWTFSPTFDSTTVSFTNYKRPGRWQKWSWMASIWGGYWWKRFLRAVYLNHIYICIYIYIEIVCISKLISITRSCIHEITWCWFRCLNFKAFARFHKNVFFQCWYSNNLPPNNISKHHHSILDSRPGINIRCRWRCFFKPGDTPMLQVERQLNLGGWISATPKIPISSKHQQQQHPQHHALAVGISVSVHPWKIKKPWNKHPILMVFTRKEGNFHMARFV